MKERRAAIRPGASALLLAGCALLLAGCAGGDPFARPGTWRENGAPMHNIAVELVNPHDLVAGRGDTRLSGPIAETAVGGALKAPAGGGGGGGASAAPLGGGGGGGGMASSGGLSGITQ
ncbi:unnamed protein product [Acidocella sp. C78]|uniref:hypothetical protein n=1 Tax=Acidocella sp. C78 TaxID=1671486 RepID=UPI00191B9FA3|nr:hypothetical protein [Acidocella sp. C78]CAG4924958.1 unnamed protein product [Acidocella sp. C78]